LIKEYTIQDPNTGQEKYWIVSKRTSEQIDAFLLEGHNLLKIQRLGSGNDTRYNVISCINPMPSLYFLRSIDQNLTLSNTIATLFTR
jgi:hypothetical protein